MCPDGRVQCRPHPATVTLSRGLLLLPCADKISRHRAGLKEKTGENSRRSRVIFTALAAALQPGGRQCRPDPYYHGCAAENGGHHAE